MTKEKQFEYKKERLLTIDIPFPFILKTFLVILILLGVWYIFLYKQYIYVYLTKPKSRNIGLFFTMLTSLTLMLFITACGVKIYYGKKLIILILFIILLLLIDGYFNISVGIEFRKNYGLLRYETFESDSNRGIKFFVYNFWNFWIFVYLMCVAFTGDDN